MPHITIKVYPDVTEEQKKELAANITKEVMAVTGKPEIYITVAIIDVPEDKWMEEVYDSEIKPNIDSLYKKPGY